MGVWGGHSKIKVGGTAPPSCHFKNGGTSPEEKKLAAGAEFFFTKKEGQQGFPREFLVGGGVTF